MKRIVINKADIQTMNLSSLMCNIHGDYWDRFQPKAREHYRLLVNITRQFEASNFLDLGTSHGGSAFSMATSLEGKRPNTVVSIDIDDARFRQNKRNISLFTFPKNIIFDLRDAKKIHPEFYSNFQVIMIDITHNGEDERTIYDNICKSDFSGLLIMDDIDYKHKFPKLKEYWQSIEATKFELDYCHISGTGLIPFKGIDLVIT